MISHRRPERNPLSFVLFAVLSVSTFGLALGWAPLPNSLADASQTFGRISAALLCVGGFGGCTSMMLPNRDSGTVWEQFFTGLLCTGAACYALALGIATGWSSNSWIALGMSAGIAAGALARVIQIQRYVWGRKADGEDQS